MTREEVYKVIDTERDYQDNKWSTKIDNPSSFILWMEEYLSQARALVSVRSEVKGSKDSQEVMDVIRKVTALGVACMEANGAPKRYKVSSTTDHGPNGMASKY